MKVVLASASPRRRELLSALIDEFEVVASDVPEEFEGDAVEDAQRLAADKAREVAATRPGCVVVAADTIVFDDARLYGKPADDGEAREMLHQLRGRDHCVVTGIALAVDGTLQTGASVSRVTIAELSDDEVAEYVRSGVPLDKAGAYAIQHEELPVVSDFDGCYCTVVGLPLWSLRSLLEQAGVSCRRPDESHARCASCPDRTPVSAGTDQAAAP